MKIEKCKKEAFTVIGKEGSTNDGEGFIERLWREANSHFGDDYCYIRYPNLTRTSAPGL